MRAAFRVLILFVLLGIIALPALSEELGTVTASALVLRDGPGLSYAMLGEIPQGATLVLLAFDEGWYHVRYQEQLGYVSARYVRVALPGAAGEGAERPPVDWAVPAEPEGVTPSEGMGQAAEQPIAASDPLALSEAATGIPSPLLTFTGENNPGYPRVMKLGDMGNSVIDLQVTLQGFGHTVGTDGQYGYDTQAAVMELQRAMGTFADGVVGPLTRQLIGGDGSGAVERLDWWYGGNVAIARLCEAAVVDVRTGRRFRISRYGGDNHCDAEPLTKEDTQAMLEIVGGEWTWDRRPIWLEAGGRVIAASMNCMPHEGQHIMDNGFAGHFCIHLFSSRTHDTDRIDEEHAACVEEAWLLRDTYAP